MDRLRYNSVDDFETGNEFAHSTVLSFSICALELNELS